MSDACPHCGTNLDGELIVDTFIEQGETPFEAIAIASHYSGWEEYGLDNRWSRKIGIYDIDRDMTTKYKCPDCNKEWSR